MVDPKDPSELSEDEQEARQTGVPLDEVITANATPAAKRAAKKAPKKEAKPKKMAKKSASKKSAKKAPKKAPKKAKTVYVKKGEKNGNPSKRGPKGSKNPKRNAPDGGIFGRKVDRARKEKGWTQEKLAAKAGITQSAVCNIVKGTAGASDKLAAKLAKLLGLK